MIIIKSPHTKEEFKNYYHTRWMLTREMMGMPKGTEKDDYEPISMHFMAIDEETKEIAGVVKLMVQEPGCGRFSYLAVVDGYQGKGVGKLLLNTVEAKARELNCKCLGTLARPTNVGYYEREGYESKGLTKILYGKLHLIYVEKSLQ